MPEHTTLLFFDVKPVGETHKYRLIFFTIAGTQLMFPDYGCLLHCYIDIGSK
jgi:phage baseplate assembly protein W